VSAVVDAERSENARSENARARDARSGNAGTGESRGPAEYRWGEGTLARASALIYTLLVAEFFFLLTAVPGLIPLVLLDRDPSNLPLVALCLVPLGPALSAMLFALRHRSRDLTDLHPAAAFWRGYRLNVWPVLRLWVPWLLGMTVISVNLAYFQAAAVPGWWAALLVIIAVGATLWMVNALVITSLFAFRARDVARLATYFLARTPGATLGNACLLIVALGVTYYLSEAVLALLTWAFAQFLLLTNRSTISEVTDRFTA